MNPILNYFSEIFYGVKSLLTGMKVTGKNFVSPWRIVTQKYPENRKELKMFERFKGEVTMPHNEKNEHKCTACGLCELACPNGSIKVLSNMVETAEGKKRKELDKYIYHLSMCTFCGLCIKACPSNAIVFGNEFEHAVFNIDLLTKQLNNPNSKLEKPIKKEEE